MKTSLIATLKPTKEISDLNLIYMRVGDLAICPTILLADNGEKSYRSKGIPFHHLLSSFNKCADFDISEEDLIKSSISNTKRLYPATVCSIQEYIDGSKPQYDISSYRPTLNNLVSGIVLSNTSLNSGAIALFYPKVCKQLAYYCFQDNFYAVPVSADYYLITPKRYFDFNAAVESLKATNESINEGGLGSCILYYDSYKDKLIICKKEYSGNAYLF